MKADLHIHSTCSDGVLTPKQIVETAARKKLIAFAITDHDTLSGIKEAKKYMKKNSPTVFVPGIELTCDEPGYGFIDIHLLGLFIDETAKPINQLVEKSKNQRTEQKKDIIRKMNELGFGITFEDAAKFATGEIGRPHVAEALKEKYPTEFRTTEEAFRKYLANNKPGYVKRKEGIRIKEAINAIRKSKGAAVLAHPGVYEDEYAKEIIKFFKAAGGQGIETKYSYHSSHGIPKKESERKNRLFSRIAEENGLLKSGGTDYHGGERKIGIGEEGITKKEFEELKKLAK